MSTDYTWTAPQALDRADHVEIAGVLRTMEGDKEISNEVNHGAGPSDFFSVYLHKQGEGADCIADRNTAAEARAFGAGVAWALCCPVEDFINAEDAK